MGETERVAVGKSMVAVEVRDVNRDAAGRSTLARCVCVRMWSCTEHESGESCGGALSSSRCSPDRGMLVVSQGVLSG